jgi:hypothetical protein
MIHCRSKETTSLYNIGPDQKGVQRDLTYIGPDQRDLNGKGWVRALRTRPSSSKYIESEEISNI